jgi:hypothetical protein
LAEVIEVRCSTICLCLLFTAVTLTILIEFDGDASLIEFSADDADKVRCVLVFEDFLVQVGTSLLKYLGEVIDLRHSTNV